MRPFGNGSDAGVLLAFMWHGQMCQDVHAVYMLLVDRNVRNRREKSGEGDYSMFSHVVYSTYFCIFGCQALLSLASYVV
jgi:hypothetical protein